MEWIRQLQEAIRYTEAHLLEDIHYDEVASHVWMSSYSFHRTFSLMAGMTVNEYIRNRRLSLAAQELQQTALNVLDAAASPAGSFAFWQSVINASYFSP